MSFQWVIDNAASIKFDNRPMVSQTQTRSGVTRSVLRGSQPWVFEVTPPAGPAWDESVYNWGLASRYGRQEETTINFSLSGLSWMFAYRGDLTNLTTLNAGFTAGNMDINLTGGSGGSAYRFRAGDIIQLGNYVYMITQDVGLAITNNIRIHRPIIESGSASWSAGTLRTGSLCTFRVICTQFPNPIAFARNQISWDGPFVFTEVIE